ncbi:MAG: GAF domain-containing protein [Chloroflexi bacterium]|nr:GAF domain-containing protein [Chloroflexota bacterium]
MIGRLARDRQGQAAADSSGLAEGLDYTLGKALQLMSADAAAVWLLDDATGEPRIAHQMGYGAPFACAGPEPSAFHVRECLARGGPMQVDTVAEAAGGRECPCAAAGLFSALYAPLSVEGRTLGALGVYKASPHRFSTAEHNLLSVFAGMAGLAIARSRLYQETREQLLELGVLSQASEALNAPADREALMQVIVGQAMEVMNASACCLVLVDEDGQVMQHRSGGLDQAHRHNLEVETALARRVMGADRAIAAWDVAASVLPIDRALAERERLVSVASAPLVHQRKAVGVIHIYTRERRLFEEPSLRLLSTFANHAAAALEHAYLFEELVRTEAARRLLEQSQARANTLANLHEAAQEFGTTLVLDQVLDLLCRATGQIGAPDMLTIRMADATGSLSRVMRAKGLSAAYLDGLCRGQCSSLAAEMAVEVAATMRPVLVGDLSEIRDSPDYPALLKEGTRSFGIFPLTARGRVIGSICVGYRTPRRFDPEVVEGLAPLAHYAGSAIQNALLYEHEREVQREKDEFFSIVAHELRSPLTAINGYAQLLNRVLPAGSDELLRRSATSIIEQTRRLRELVDNLLDSSRLALGRFALERAEVDLAVLARQVVESLQVSTDKHAIQISVPDTCVALCDQKRVHQVLENLIGNAIKYSPAGGPIEVKLEADGQEARLSVRDHGIGISPDHLSHIFERYYQVETADGARSGLGVGLNVCQEIVLAHGGRIWAESKPGEGSIFYFALPLGYEEGRAG